ncbi:hypothetical protein GGD61_002871 [Bradyrhizobium sp. SBR1B]|nr:hypothetical protein [Bradyrhizobium sp. SBR1B]
MNIKHALFGLTVAINLSGAGLMVLLPNEKWIGLSLTVVASLFGIWIYVLNAIESKSLKEKVERSHVASSLFFLQNFS